jgi:hypothetical protein
MFSGVQKQSFWVTTQPSCHFEKRSDEKSTRTFDARADCGGFLGLRPRNDMSEQLRKMFSGVQKPCFWNKKLRFLTPFSAFKEVITQL